jgi:hypothetical protein
MPSSPVFAQILTSLHPEEFARCAAQFPAARPARGLSAYDHFLALCFAQFTQRESLRDIQTCLNARADWKYHMGFRGRLTRTNLAYANAHRDWRIFAAVAQVLMRRAQRLYQKQPMDPELPHLAFALDSSLIHLSLKLFPWAFFSKRQATAVKLHLLLSLRGSLPAWAAITEANLPDQKMMDAVPVQPGCFYIMDRGYLDFSRLHRIHLQKGCFIVRGKCHVSFHVLASRPVNKDLGLRCDQTIRLKTTWSKKQYPDRLRRVRLRDEVAGRSLVFLTNNFDLSAEIIAQLYRRRWAVELFFKWIKQHLRIRTFLGRTPNAVRCQIWSAVCAYLMVAITKKTLLLSQSLYEIMQILSVHAFEQTPLVQLLAKTTSKEINNPLQKTFLFNDL